MDQQEQKLESLEGNIANLRVDMGMSWQLDGMDDDALSEADLEEDREEKSDNMQSTKLTIINTDAISLCPKITSLMDCMDELQGTVAVVTGTWLADGEPLDADMCDLAHGAGLGLIHKNRAPNAHGVAHGGVAVIYYKKNACNMTRVEIQNPDNHEVLVTAGNLPGYKEKLVVVACYIPPNYPIPRGRANLAYIEDTVLELKRRALQGSVFGGCGRLQQVGRTAMSFP